MDGAGNSILNNASLIKKTYFARQALPISNIIANLINFLFCLIILFSFSIFYRRPIFDSIYWLPAIILTQLILIIGMSLLFSGLNTLYREAQFIMDILLLIWFYVTPIVYPFEMAKNALRHGWFEVYSLNPMLGISVAYQQFFSTGQLHDPGFLLYSFIISVFVFVLGWFVLS